MDTNWDIARLNQLISSRSEESLNLEYKAAAAISEKKRDDITKHISAMANSDGGTIIYGMAENTVNRHLPGNIDPIDRILFSKEWLEQVASNIRPRIDSLKIIPVEVQSNPNHVVYVVEVPKGTTAHQAADFKYYRRYNFQACPIDDYQIRELMNRRKNPTVLLFAALAFHGDGGSLHVKIDNTSDVLAQDFAVAVWTPLMWNGKTFVFVEEEDKPIMSYEYGAPSYKALFHNASGPPLFPKSTISHNFRFRFTRIAPMPKMTIDKIHYLVFADAMPFLRGTFDPEKISGPTKLG